MAECVGVDYIIVSDIDGDDWLIFTDSIVSICRNKKQKKSYIYLVDPDSEPVVTKQDLLELEQMLHDSDFEWE